MEINTEERRVIVVEISTQQVFSFVIPGNPTTRHNGGVSIHTFNIPRLEIDNFKKKIYYYLSLIDHDAAVKFFINEVEPDVLKKCNMEKIFENLKSEKCIQCSNCKTDGNCSLEYCSLDGGGSYNVVD